LCILGITDAGVIIDSCEDTAVVATPGNLEGIQIEEKSHPGGGLKLGNAFFLQDPFSLSCGFGSSLGIEVEGMAFDNPMYLKGEDPLPISFSAVFFSSAGSPDAA